MTGRPILVIEDSDEDFEAIRWALRRLGREVLLERCIDGDQALERLRDPGLRWPSVILLDLNLPGVDGREVLGYIKTSARLSVLPVLVMSTSGSEDDIQACYDAGANSYLIKPVNFEQFTEQIRVLCNFWLDTARLPEPERPSPDARPGRSSR